jgi:N-acetylglucosaminyldiphosphoundecaprenol N-acetyl-beta-D-mannosaminyltransferase
LVHVLGVKIVNETFEQALERLEPILAGRAATALFFVNAHTLNLAASDPGYRRELNEADLVYGDGTGVRWAAKARGIRMKANLNGTDLVPALLARGRGLRCYLLGATPEAIERAAAHFRQAYPGCVLAGHHHGYLDEAATNSVIDAINAADVDLLLVGMGNPLQERWIARHRARLEVGLCAGVGGLFTYWAGDLDRAPCWMRRVGIEWLHILRRQPQKFQRYVLGNPLFLLRLLLWLPADLLRPQAPPAAAPALGLPVVGRRFTSEKTSAMAVGAGAAFLEQLTPDGVLLLELIVR